MGYKIPALVTYANGFLVYLPEPGAFPEGGYEPAWAVSLGLSKQFQPRVWQAIEPVLKIELPDYHRLNTVDKSNRRWCFRKFNQYEA